MLKIQSLSW